ncbi:monocopper oxidase-like protein SKS1 [Aristolochia californica]|uniref:monocopper oxidase-like protein SKS1 n=1 Tax=Aristolochia californica TaxID=171875 RepID=UPI0035D81587
MGGSTNRAALIQWAVTILCLFAKARCIDIYLDWNVTAETIFDPLGVFKPVIKINGMFPGPLINATTNDYIHVNIFNSLDEPLLMTWNGIQQRLNSWEDGVSGTNCPIRPGKNWTYVFETKDQIGTFFYFPSTRFQKAAGAFGPIRVNNRNVILVPFPKPEAEFDLLIGDWYGISYKDARASPETANIAGILLNGKGSYWTTQDFESFNVTQGKTYRFRVSNVGSRYSLNFRIQNHQMLIVETEGSYTNQIAVDSLDIHVGQSFSVLVTANQTIGDYAILASVTQAKLGAWLDFGAAVLHYDGSTTPPSEDIPSGPNPMDRVFSVNQARSIRWNMTAGAARPNRQGAFNVTNVTLSQTFVLRSSRQEINGVAVRTVNNVSYLTPATPLKLADHFNNGSGVYQLDAFPVNSVNLVASYGTSVVSGYHKGWVEIVFKNDQLEMDSWHLDGFGFYVVGFGDGEWSNASKEGYNLFDPVVRATVQVYPGGWTAVYAFLDNPGMWNLRSQNLMNWYMGEELYVRVYDPDPNPAKERPPPQNLLICGTSILVLVALVGDFCF